MRRPVFILAFLTLSVAVGVTAALSGNCRDFLLGNEYICRGITETNETLSMKLGFTQIGAGPKFNVRIGPTIAGVCSCKARSVKLNKPDNVKFNTARGFDCLLSGPEGSGPELAGPEFSGPESFLVNRSSLEGKATKKTIKVGQGIDRVGGTLAYDCELED